MFKVLLGRRGFSDSKASGYQTTRNKAGTLAKHLARGLAATALVSTVVLTGAGTAEASATDGVSYWANDGCHYFMSNGAWYSDGCAAHEIDAKGTVNLTEFDLYTYSPTSADHLGTLQLQIDLTDPKFVAIRVPSNPIFQEALWVRQQVGEPGAEVQFELYDSSTARYAWWTVAELRELISESERADTVVIGGEASVLLASLTDDDSMTVTVGGGSTSLGTLGLGQSRGSLLDQPFIPALALDMTNSAINLSARWVEPTCYYTVSPSECG